MDYLLAMQGLKETKQDRERDRERKRLAEAYDSLDSKSLVKEHWSSKAREDMTERDWRIFREDFNISYKGINVSGAALPYRNWDEAQLPESLMKSIKELVSPVASLSFAACDSEHSRSKRLPSMSKKRACLEGSAQIIPQCCREHPRAWQPAWIIFVTLACETQKADI